MHHRIENRQQLAHRGYEGNLRRFAGGAQALVELPDDRVPARRYQGRHVQGRADGRSTAPDGPVPAPPPAVAIEGRHAHQRGNLLAIEQAQLRQFGQHRAAHHRPNAGHTLQQIFPRLPHGALLDHVVQVLIHPRQFGAQPAQMGLDPLPDPSRGERQAILFGALHRQHLAAPCQEGRQTPASGHRGARAGAVG